MICGMIYNSRSSFPFYKEMLGPELALTVALGEVQRTMAVMFKAAAWNGDCRCTTPDGLLGQLAAFSATMLGRSTRSGNEF